MGIYVHVPFCRSKCFYCGFYSVASLTLKEAYLEAVEREIVLRRGYLPRQEMKTLYFGGGTPSYLEHGDLERIIRKLEENYLSTNVLSVTKSVFICIMILSICVVFRSVSPIRDITLPGSMDWG